MSGNNKENSTDNNRVPSLASAIAEASAEVKGKDISVLDVRKVFSLSDYFIVVSGRSDRQVQGICNKITAATRALGRKPLAIEGYEKAHWILMDFEDVIVHIFYEPVREHYGIETLWRDASLIELPNLEKPRAA